VITLKISSLLVIIYKLVDFAAFRDQGDLFRKRIDYDGNLITAFFKNLIKLKFAVHYRRPVGRSGHGSL
jgi:hypothetical protein